MNTDTQVDLLSPVRTAMGYAESLWSKLDLLRHEVSACDGLSQEGNGTIQCKLDLASNMLREVISLLFTAASNKECGRAILTEAAAKQLDEKLHGKF